MISPTGFHKMQSVLAQWYEKNGSTIGKLPLLQSVQYLVGNMSFRCAVLPMQWRKGLPEMPGFLSTFPSCPPMFILVVASQARGRSELEKHWVDRDLLWAVSGLLWNPSLSALNSPLLENTELLLYQLV